MIASVTIQGCETLCHRPRFNRFFSESRQKAIVSSQRYPDFPVNIQKLCLISLFFTETNCVSLRRTQEI